MRPTGKGEFESLYFDYPSFTAPDREHVLAQNRFTVAIVGAGPVGMFAALTMARFGIPSVLFDNKDTFNDGSRAICIQRSSYQALERAGAVASFLDKPYGWTKGRTFYRGQQILEFEMPHSDSDKYLPMYNIQQQYIEQYLWDAVEASELIETRWCSEVTGIEDTEGGVRLSVRDTNGEYTCDAEWVMAADGARSPIRGMRGLRLKGDNFPGRYVIADVQMDHDYPTIRRALFDSKSNPDKTILIHRQPDNIWRIDYQLPEGQTEEEAIREDNIRANVSRILNDIGHEGAWELEWWSIYAANTLALDDYRDGRVIFIGDSAHIVPIFGVRGLNNGLADAENAGWKLARVVKGLSDETLLDSYSPERRGATLDVFENASKSARFMTPPTKGWALMRDAALSLSLKHEWAGEFANPRQMVPFTYSDGGAVLKTTSSASGLKPGTVLPDEKLSEGTYLSDLLGNGFTLLMLNDTPAIDLAELRNSLTSADPELELVTGSKIREQFGEQALLRVITRLEIVDGAVLLIRPDGYLGAIWDPNTASEIVAQVKKAYGKKEAN
ncbi:3-(3-hydroxy-phenyl)propionate/3-hydroxycinnamic acid hydroxylase [Aliiroseovarius pelagivivens]|uniref:3-(3-hydroxy-phenyl)propionate/3-hydroxycinnamic acid hydroxylase n=1 Tax=Aliiroseovarius pelagivivens TaxID=1639690 RepID=A0A2R8ASP5_9RHOB|nr:FAD-dependent monooxygenase [Aliiroseovarius pelagivivens]SPF78889.1 3-(3-hydroxy-phenyl)propionate/3-hydroxycinnamic acid hydroxylase [Aliiroseovarius pelagivivens]